MSVYRYWGNFARMPSLGLVDCPCPTLSGTMMKYSWASSGWPLPYSGAPNHSLTSPRPEFPVPWRTSTAFRTVPFASLAGVPTVR
jgi:hypothetical protein